MLHVPKLRQPDSISCFPTAVLAVLEYYGTSPGLETVREACRMGRHGVLQELPIQGLREAAIDVEVIDSPNATSIGAALDDDRPVILTVETAGTGREAFGHALVVCALEGDLLTVMDPLWGDYRTVSLSELLPHLGRGLNGGLLVSGSGEKVSGTRG